MWDFIKRHAEGFWQGAVGGGLVCGLFILRIDFGVSNETVDAILKILSIAGAAIVAGMGKVIGEEVVKKVKPYGWRVVYWFKDGIKRFKKPKIDKDDRYKQNGQRRA